MSAVGRLSSRDGDFSARLRALLAFDTTQDNNIESAVAEILCAVRTRGDQAVMDYTGRFDHFDVPDMEALQLQPDTLRIALDNLPLAQRKALEAAAARIRFYHEKQKASSWSYTESDGTVLGQKITALDRIGVYVPGGKAAYPSTVLMNTIPARVAGVGEVVMVVPTPGGQRNELVLAAAHVAGVDRVFTIGGAQAIAALAYGTESIPQVDKIVGPGNAYVAAAKRKVFGVVGIDMVAGPSEILVICDGATDPDWIAMDLFSQAEHDEMAQAILLSPDTDFLEQVSASIDRQLADMPRRQIIATSLANRGALIQVADLDEACDIANQIAPEHLELSVAHPQKLLDRITNAGAVFLGRYASESLGDYCAGPNHVLPTGRTARFSSPLGVYDFQKRTSLIDVSRAGAQTLGPIAAELAQGEGLFAHAQAARLRLDR
jgi:histidinol dehydrogenase